MEKVGNGLSRQMVGLQLLEMPMHFKKLGTEPGLWFIAFFYRLRAWRVIKSASGKEGA